MDRIVLALGRRSALLPIIVGRISDKEARITTDHWLMTDLDRNVLLAASGCLIRGSPLQGFHLRQQVLCATGFLVCGCCTRHAPVLILLGILVFLKVEVALHQLKVQHVFGRVNVWKDNV